MPKEVTKRFRWSQSVHPFLRNQDESAKPSEEVAIRANIDETSPPNKLLEAIRKELNTLQSSGRSVGIDILLGYLTPQKVCAAKSADLENVVREVIKLMLDQRELVRTGALDALSYLASMSDVICDQVYTAGILETILDFFETFLLPLDMLEMKSDNLQPFFECFDLLSTICGTCPKAITSLSTKYSDRMVVITLKCIDTNLLDEPRIELIISAVQFLSIIADDNEAQRHILKNVNLCKTLNLLLSINPPNESLAGFHCLAFFYLRTVLISITFYSVPNLSQLKESNKKQLFEQLSVVFKQIFNQPEAEAYLTELSKSIKVSIESDSSQKSKIRSLHQHLKYLYLAKRNCLELLTNLTTSSEVDYDDAMAVDDDVHQETIQLDPLLESFITDNQIVELILKPNPKREVEDQECSVLEAHHIGQHVNALVQTYRIASLALLSNILSSSLGNQFQMKQQDALWSLIYGLSQNCDNLMIDVVDEALNVIREFCSKFSEPVRLTSKDMDIYFELLKSRSSCLSPCAQVNIIKIIASVPLCLGSDAKHHPALVQKCLTHLVAAFRLAQNDLVQLAETLDSIIDILSDEDTLYSLKEKDRGRLYQDMIKFRRKFESLIAKNSSVENPVVETVAANIEPFLTYLRNAS